MPYSNIVVSVADPDSLIAGTSSYAAFVAAYIKVYRFTSEANARALSGPVLAATFTLVPSTTTPVSDTAGPWRYSAYDASQLSSSWYRYYFTDVLGTTVSRPSRPFLPPTQGTTLATLIYEVGSIFEDDVSRGTIDAGTAATAASLTNLKIFKSTLRDTRWWQGCYALIESNANGAGTAPEGEEANIDQVNAGTGVATLDGVFSANVEAGDIFQVHPMAPPSRIIRSINLVRERMFTVVNHDIALQQTATRGNRYPAPPGVKETSDIYAAKAVRRSQNQPDWEDVWTSPIVVEFDGFQGWIYTTGASDAPILRIRHELSYRDLEGNLSLMSDTTQAELSWLRKAAAWEIYKWIDRAEGMSDRFMKLSGMTEQELTMLSGRYAPDTPARPLQTGHREPIGPVRI